MIGENTSWRADRGDGTYRNPVLFADYSDPDVIRLGEQFYMTAPSFNGTPGLPVLRSPDLVNWELIGHGIKNFPHPRYGECRPGCGAWAPAIRYDRGICYIVFPSPDEGLYVVETEDPSGEWSEPRLLLEGRGLIDPCPLWDEDGKAYVVHGYAFSRSGKKSILTVVPVSADLAEVLGEGRDAIHAMGRLPTLEGPKFHKSKGKYYISAPAGGVAQGWQMVFRSDSVNGPYEEKTVLAQRGSPTNGPHQGSPVDDRQGNWPLAGTGQDDAGVGRPVQAWKKPAGSSLRLAGGLYREGEGKGEVEGMDPFGLYPRILAQKINAPEFSAEVALRGGNFAAGDEGGIVPTGMETARLCLRRGERRYLGPPFQAVEGRWIEARFGLYCLKRSGENAPALEVFKVMINGSAA